jgi:hypothetical protein
MIPGMTDIKPTRLVRKRRIRFKHGHGPVYAWLRTHYLDILPLEATESSLWVALVADMASDGIRDARGNPPTAHNARLTWKRVCHDIAAEEAAEAAAPWKFKRKPPSKMSPSWRPIVVIRPGQSPPPGWPADRVEVEPYPTRPGVPAPLAPSATAATPSSALVPRPPAGQTTVATTGADGTAQREFTPEQREFIDRAKAEIDKANREADEYRFRVSRLG